MKTREEFKKEMQGKRFVVVFDSCQSINEFWSEHGFTKNESEAKVFNGDFDTDEEFEAFNNFPEVRAVWYRPTNKP